MTYEKFKHKYKEYPRETIIKELFYKYDEIKLLERKIKRLEKSLLETNYLLSVLMKGEKIKDARMSMPIMSKTKDKI